MAFLDDIKLGIERADKGELDFMGETLTGDDVRDFASLLAVTQIPALLQQGQSRLGGLDQKPVQDFMMQLNEITQQTPTKDMPTGIPLNPGEGVEGIVERRNDRIEGGISPAPKNMTGMLGGRG